MGMGMGITMNDVRRVMSVVIMSFIASSSCRFGGSRTFRRDAEMRREERGERQIVDEQLMLDVR